MLFIFTLYKLQFVVKASPEKKLHHKKVYNAQRPNNLNGLKPDSFIIPLRVLGKKQHLRSSTQSGRRQL